MIYKCRARFGSAEQDLDVQNENLEELAILKV